MIWSATRAITREGGWVCYHIIILWSRNDAILITIRMLPLIDLQNNKDIFGTRHCVVVFCYDDTSCPKDVPFNYRVSAGVGG